MPASTENEALIQHALAYVIALYRELTQENGAPPLGTQNQAVDLILADPDLRDAVSRWAGRTETEEATTAPPRRLPRDDAYDRVRAFLASAIGTPVFEEKERNPV